jgi:hypothetical protein
MISGKFGQYNIDEQWLKGNRVVERNWGGFA